MRTLEKPDTIFLTGMQIFHNYVGPHEDFKGKMPADAAFCVVESFAFDCDNIDSDCYDNMS